MSTWGGRRAVALTKQVIELYGSTCHLCLERINLAAPPRHPSGPSADHVVPRKYGGSDHLSNLRPAHRRCNSRRGARLLTPELLASFRRRPARSAASFFRGEAPDTPPTVSISPRTGPEKNGMTSKDTEGSRS
ncbi:HNH endonuclease [Luteimicrobium sp. NPDC057192]|uniref:HNH endonuclease n=1 Tax=Luteimicrobium sp. NPDC057192 TaxID=3346042 RepID=UPI00362F6BB8